MEGKEAKTKIKKYEEDRYVMKGYYDTVYVNMGIGCCEKLSRCKSHNVDNTNQKFEIEVEKLNMPRTPMDWVKEVPASAIIVGPQTMDERGVTYITFTKDGADYEMWLDDTYGAAHKVVITTDQGELVYKYNDMKFNMLEESEFNPPCD